MKRRSSNPGSFRLLPVPCWAGRLHLDLRRQHLVLGLRWGKTRLVKFRHARFLKTFPFNVRPLKMN